MAEKLVFTHTDKCVAYERDKAKRMAAIALERGKWEGKYPHFCRACGGSGGRETYDSDTGFHDFDDCQHCLGHNNCPRCMTSIEGEDWKCAACGWNFDSIVLGEGDMNVPPTVNDVYDYEPECECDRQRADEALDRYRNEEFERWQAEHPGLDVLSYLSSERD